MALGALLPRGDLSCLMVKAGAAAYWRQFDKQRKMGRCGQLHAVPTDHDLLHLTADPVSFKLAIAPAVRSRLPWPRGHLHQDRSNRAYTASFHPAGAEYLSAAEEAVDVARARENVTIYDLRVGQRSYRRLTSEFHLPPWEGASYSGRSVAFWPLADRPLLADRGG